MEGARYPVGKAIKGTYRIERLLGTGGMGAVYEVSHLRFGRRFALKLLTADTSPDTQAFARFRQEAEIIGKLGHPHIVDAVDFDRTPEGAPFIVMELLEGENLAELLTRVRQLEPAHVASILRQAASALHAAHQQKIIHRDLKPQNIFLCRRGQRSDYVKLLDFGISKVLNAQSMLTSGDITMGTPGYMAPEQAQGDAVDHRADIFSMGIIVYEMIAGELPFAGDSPIALLYSIVRNPHAPLSTLRPGLPSTVEAVVDRALSKRPGERFDTMLEFANAFSKAVKEDWARGEEFTEYTEDRGPSWIAETQPVAADSPAAQQRHDAIAVTVLNTPAPGSPVAREEAPAVHRGEERLLHHFIAHCDERQERFSAMATDLEDTGAATTVPKKILAELHDFLGEAQFLGLDQVAAAALSLIDVLETETGGIDADTQRVKLLSLVRRLMVAAKQLAHEAQDSGAQQDVRQLRAEIEGGQQGALRRVLICDDSLIVRSVLALDLEERGYSVAVAADGTELEQRLGEFSPDAIFLDINLPTINGDEVCRRIRATDDRRAVPIIFLSSLSEEELAKLARQAGADGFISKRHRRESLLACFARLLPPIDREQ